MKRFIIVYCLLMIVSVCSSQTQQGYVKTRGRLGNNGTLIAGQRLSGVTISIKGRNVIQSENNGTFSFAVPTKTFNLTNVQKNGYQLCDRDFLSKQYQVSGNPLIVVMETLDNTLADKLTAEQKIRRTLRRQLQEKEDEIERLKEQQKITEEQYRKQLQNLFSAQKNNEKLISDMAERYSTLDFDQLDDFQRQVAALIQNGELVRADSLLNAKGSMEERSAELDRIDATIKIDADDLIKRKNAHDKSVAMKAKILKDFAADCYSHYEICKMLHKNDSAAYWLELRASKDTMNVEWLLDTGSFIDEYLANYNLSLEYYQRALNVCIAQYGENNPNAAICYNKIGGLNVVLKKRYKSEEYFQKALKIRLAYFGENHPEVADSYMSLGDYYINYINLITDVDSIKAQEDKSWEYYQKASKILMVNYGENHQDVATCYNKIGMFYFDKQDYSKALEYYQKALKIFLKVYGENHQDIAAVYNNMGLVYKKGQDIYSSDLYKDEEENYSLAVEYYQKALKIQLEIYGDNNPLVKTICNNIGVFYAGKGDYLKAIEYLQKALKIEIEIFGDKHTNVAFQYSELGMTYSLQGDRQNALDSFQKALKIQLNYWGENNIFVAECYEKLGNAYEAIENNLEALDNYQKALKIKQKLYEEDDIVVMYDYYNIGRIYYKQDEFLLAYKYLKKGLDILGFEYVPVGDPTEGECYKLMVFNYWKAKTDKGIELPGFNEFMSSKVFATFIYNADSPAAINGMDGMYIMLEYDDWTMESGKSLFDRDCEMEGKPKDILVMGDDDVISKYHFDDEIGSDFIMINIGVERKQEIINIYHKWKKENK